MNMLYIGIDPPQGMATWDSNTKELELYPAMSFWKIIRILMKLEGEPVTVVVEATYKNQPAWHRPGRPTPEDFRKWGKLNRNIGMNQITAKLIVEYCEANNLKVIESRPGKGSMTKLTADQFRKITGYNGKSCQHSRDAAMLIYGR